MVEFLFSFFKTKSTCTLHTCLDSSIVAQVIDVAPRNVHCIWSISIWNHCYYTCITLLYMYYLNIYFDLSVSIFNIRRISVLDMDHVLWSIIHLTLTHDNFYWYDKCKHLNVMIWIEPVVHHYFLFQTRVSNAVTYVSYIKHFLKSFISNIEHILGNNCSLSKAHVRNQGNCCPVFLLQGVILFAHTNDYIKWHFNWIKVLYKYSSMVLVQIYSSYLKKRREKTFYVKNNTEKGRRCHCTLF